MRHLVVVVVLTACGSVSNEGKHDAGPTDVPRQVDAAPDGAVAFSPSQLTGLVLWLDAGKGVVSTSNAVSGWQDQSSAGNNAVQLTTTRQPTLVASSINGLPTIHFDGTNSVMSVADSNSLAWGTDDFTIAVVTKFNNAQANYAAFYTKQQENISPYVGASIWANFPSPSQSTKFGLQLDANTGHYITSTATGLNDNMPHLLIGHRSGTMLEIRINGTQDTMANTATTLNATATGYSLFIGGHITGGNTVIQALSGDIAEMLAIHGPLTDTEMGKLETYLKTKYGL